MHKLEKKISEFIEKHITTESLDCIDFYPEKLQAHRGLHNLSIVENSISSFRNAKKNNILMSECDIHLSKDKIPVIYHDDDMKRLHNDTRRVSEVSAKELWQRHLIPTLEMVLCDTKSTPFWNLEIKSNQIVDTDLPRRVAEIIIKTGAQKRVMVSSFNPFYIWHMQNLLPRVPRALIATKMNEEKNNFLLRTKTFAPLLKVHFLNLNYQDFSMNELDRLSNKINICLWTVNKSKDIDKYLDLGIKSVISDTCYLSE